MSWKLLVAPGPNVSYIIHGSFNGNNFETGRIVESEYHEGRSVIPAEDVAEWDWMIDQILDALPDAAGLVVFDEHHTVLRTEP